MHWSVKNITLVSIGKHKYCSLLVNSLASLPLVCQIMWKLHFLALVFCCRHFVLYLSLPVNHFWLADCCQTFSCVWWIQLPLPWYIAQCLPYRLLKFTFFILNFHCVAISEFYPKAGLFGCQLMFRAFLLISITYFPEKLLKALNL